MTRRYKFVSDSGMLECQPIKGVRPHKFRTGRKEHPWTYSPEFFFSDDLVLSFNVVETKSGEYGVELYIAQGRKVRDS